MKISFLVTYYQQKKYIAQSMESLLALEKPGEWEILIGDDGSTDGSIELEKEYVRRDPEHIRLFVMPRDPDKTYTAVERAGANRLNLVRQAAGDYYCIIDGDDFYSETDFLPEAVRVLEAQPQVTVVAFDTWTWREGEPKRAKKAGSHTPVPEKRDGSQVPYVFPAVCPVCGSPLHRFEDEAAHYCLNTDCPARVVTSIAHFASRNAMDIEGLGEKRVEQFHRQGWLNSVDEIYHLKDRKDEILSLEKFGAKSYDNLVRAIENSKENSLERLLFGLGIRQVGEKAADVLALLSATDRARGCLPVPLITMSMGSLGVASRVFGETFGSAVTFASALLLKMLHIESRFFVEPGYLYSFLADQMDWIIKVFVIIGLFTTAIAASLVGLYKSMRRER